MSPQGSWAHPRPGAAGNIGAQPGVSSGRSHEPRGPVRAWMRRGGKEDGFPTPPQGMDALGCSAEAVVMIFAAELPAGASQPRQAQEELEPSSKVWVPGASHHPNLCGSTGTASPHPQLNAHQRKDLRPPGPASGPAAAWKSTLGSKSSMEAGEPRVQREDLGLFQSKFGPEARSVPCHTKGKGLPCRKQIAGAG